MTMRREIGQRRREAQAALVARIANRAFTRKVGGLDGLAKRLLASQAPPTELDPELEHPEVEPGSATRRDER